MNSFLNRVVDFLLEKHGNRMEGIQLVFSGKRSGAFFKNQIKKSAQTAVWLPKISSINDFIEHQSDLIVSDRIETLFSFYKVYKARNPEGDDFVNFMNWAPTVLSDFDDIDRYMVSPEDIFRNLQSVRELENWELDNWSFSKAELAPLQEQFLSFWSDLKPLYTDLNDYLKENGKVRSALSYRNLADKLNSDSFDYNPVPFTYFIGLNALSNSEISIIHQLKKHNKAAVIWDYHDEIINDKVHEAGFFMRKNIEVLGKGVLSAAEANSGTKVSAYASPNNYSQVPIASSLLEANDDLNSAIIACDESLIENLQKELPPLNSAPNITAGIPISQSAIHNLIMAILKCNIKRINARSNSIHFKDYVGILQHPSIQSLLKINGINSAKIIDELVEKNIRFINHEQHNSLTDLPLLSDLLFSIKSNEDIDKFVQLILFLVENMKELIDSESHEFEQAFHVYNLQSKILTTLNDLDFKIPLTAYQILMKFYVNEYKLAYLGEPLSGVQIMGMLESRALNFKKLVLFGANEGNLPSRANFQTFIPFDLRSYFNLPGKKNKEAVHAYYFYRLLWGADEVHLIYNANTNDGASGEPSRYIKQLQYSNIISSIEFIDLPFNNLNTPIRIKKSSYVIDALDDFMKRGISSTSINDYINCPFNFAHKNLLKIYEKDEIEEGVKASSFGKIIHTTLEIFYQDKMNRLLQVEDYDNLEESVSTILKKAYLDLYPKANLTQGRIYINFKVSLSYILKFLRNEKTSIASGHEIQILGLETKLTIPFTKTDLDKTINIKGTIDRIDSYNGKIRILDYKTGTAAKYAKKPAIEELFHNPDGDKLLQLYVYALLVHKVYEGKEIICDIIYLRDLNKSFKYALKVTNENISDFEKQLALWIDELYDTDIDFTEVISPEKPTLLGYQQ